MKRFYIILIVLLYSCDIESPIEDNFVVEAFLFQGEKVDDIKIKKAEPPQNKTTNPKYI